jgi:hypothetical protein
MAYLALAYLAREAVVTPVRVRGRNTRKLDAFLKHVTLPSIQKPRSGSQLTSGERKLSTDIPKLSFPPSLAFGSPQWSYLHLPVSECTTNNVNSKITSPLPAFLIGENAMPSTESGTGAAQWQHGLRPEENRLPTSRLWKWEQCQWGPTQEGVGQY